MSDLNNRHPHPGPRPIVCESCGRRPEQFAKGWQGLLVQTTDAAVEKVVLCPTCAHSARLTGEVERLDKCDECGVAKVPWELITFITPCTERVCAECLKPAESDQLRDVLELP